MTRFVAMGGMAILLSMTNVGCYLDQLEAERRANRTLQEDLARARADLQDCELVNRQKDTQIDALTKTNQAKDQQIASLSAEAQNLRTALDKAQAILEAQAGKGPGTTIIQTQALPQALANALEDFANRHPDLVEFKNNVVRWKSDLLFPLGSDQLDGGGPTEALREFAQIINSAEAQQFDVIVVGHTDTTPIAKPETRARHETNWHLSAHRAISVMNLLVRAGIDQPRIGVMGYGEFRPIAPNDTPDNKARNRRVEVYLVPKESVQSVGQGVWQTNDTGFAFVKPSDLPDSGS